MQEINLSPFQKTGNLHLIISKIKDEIRQNQFNFLGDADFAFTDRVVYDWKNDIRPKWITYLHLEFLKLTKILNLYLLGLAIKKILIFIQCICMIN